MMQLSRRHKVLAGIGTVVVAGALFWLTELGGWEWIRGLPVFSGHQPTLVVAPVQRSGATEIFSGEKVSLHFDRAVTGRVVWLFDEQEAFLGYDAAQHAFVNDRSHPGDRQSHRVDVFFRRGAKYEAATQVVQVFPAPNFRAAARVVGAQLRLTTSTQAGDYWRLGSVTLASYAAEGVFIETTPLKAVQRDAITVSDLGTFYAVDGAKAYAADPRAEVRLWLADTGDVVRSAEAGVPWARYDFHGQHGEPLILMQPLRSAVHDSLRLIIR